MVEPFFQLSRAEKIFSQVKLLLQWTDDNANNESENPLKRLFLAIHPPSGIHEEFSCWYGAMIIENYVKENNLVVRNNEDAVESNEILRPIFGNYFLISDIIDIMYQYVEISRLHCVPPSNWVEDETRHFLNNPSPVIGDLNVKYLIHEKLYRYLRGLDYLTTEGSLDLFYFNEIKEGVLTFCRERNLLWLFQPEINIKNTFLARIFQCDVILKSQLDAFIYKNVTKVDLKIYKNLAKRVYCYTANKCTDTTEYFGNHSSLKE